MPVRKIERLILSCLELPELLLSACWVGPTRVDLTPTKQCVGMLEHSATESQSDGDPKDLRRGGLQIVIERARCHCRKLCASAELLQLPAALLPPNTHQGENEVCLVQGDALAVDPYEDLCDTLLAYVGTEFDNLKRVVLKIFDSVERLL